MEIVVKEDVFPEIISSTAIFLKSISSGTGTALAMAGDNKLKPEVVSDGSMIRMMPTRDMRVRHHGWWRGNNYFQLGMSHRFVGSL